MDLNLVEVTYFDFNGETKTGELIVHVEHSQAILTVFETLFDSEYAVESIIPIGDLPEDAEDQAGYNNTSAFNCRVVEGTSRWSQHAFGLAVDLNPLQNPFVSSREIWPEGSEMYVDRSLDEPAMIKEGDAVTTAFDSIGWHWGGRWRSLKDYQHFSSTGR